MAVPTIICVDDQREVLDALMGDLAILEPPFRLEGCESAEEAFELLEESDGGGEPVGVIVCDHVMPGKTGVEFLSEVAADGRFGSVKKLLLTGLATHADTIEAINNAQLDRYVEKPWEPQALTALIRSLLTDFVIETGIDYRPLAASLDAETLMRRIRERG